MQHIDGTWKERFWKCTFRCQTDFPSQAHRLKLAEERVGDKYCHQHKSNYFQVDGLGNLVKTFFNMYWLILIYFLSRTAQKRIRPGWKKTMRGMNERMNFKKLKSKCWFKKDKISKNNFEFLKSTFENKVSGAAPTWAPHLRSYCVVQFYIAPMNYMQVQPLTSLPLSVTARMRQPLPS